jgi:hypothetical protein
MPSYQLEEYPITPRPAAQFPGETTEFDSSPFKFSQAGTQDFTSLAQPRSMSSVRSDIKHEVRRGHLGPMPDRDFLEDFLPVEDISEFPEEIADTFVKLKHTKFEKDMSEDLVSAHLRSIAECLAYNCILGQENERKTIQCHSIDDRVQDGRFVESLGSQLDKKNPP